VTAPHLASGEGQRLLNVIRERDAALADADQLRRAARNLLNTVPEPGGHYCDLAFDGLWEAVGYRG
jgi:hypothetical protein